MPKKDKISNVEVLERRTHWRDRRLGKDRRNSGRLSLTKYDCRSNQSRRAADVSGELSEGEIWWNKVDTKYE